MEFLIPTAEFCNMFGKYPSILYMFLKPNDWLHTEEIIPEQTAVESAHTQGNTHTHETRHWITADSSSVITRWISEQVLKGQFTQTTTMTLHLHWCEAARTDLFLFAQNLRLLFVRFLLQTRSNENELTVWKKAQSTIVTKGTFIRWCKEFLNITKIPKHNSV